ncbi:TetR family transcriptional regulator [Pseudomonas sp. FH4]|jgi:AcrR family transcriptional regulator|uniref:DNA-binding transcriptional regulator, AcrR family n=1 Tax=Pseudomonas brenneri TaxID=129817 RepID=A0A5B2ULG0_9PSED|nr:MULTISPECIES: TetR/AcrR family transcriptional regulator [Pseudomonas]ETK17370.1 TetR family transcriptional regulator [Pseudomonas sp. FH4]KAA2226695.1 TetR/AcrR family transcriptional regulator [Pseudomonas brenneri]MBF8003240.1 TetR/AcrR family transcriptional regulator [Pseudomonas brenneri]TWR74903.1 TetR/AcrR family transcriptional regulator [Pseudomonas brenneri]WJM93932.1 helix-turn-helix domain containing protein [Pseudomonas brenneri]
MTSNTLTSAAERIAYLALDQFAEHGYDAASLNDIAVRAGIKKASLYAHFASKDALYVVALELALQAERDYVQSQFSKNSRSVKAPGEVYIDNLQRRYSANESLRFLLRAAFYPPAPLRGVVMSGFDDYMTTIRSHFQKGLLKAYPGIDEQASEVLAEAYLVMIDSLHVELTYGNAQAYARRLEALQQLSRAVGYEEIIRRLRG